MTLTFQNLNCLPSVILSLSLSLLSHSLLSFFRLSPSSELFIFSSIWFSLNFSTLHVILFLRWFNMCLRDYHLHGDDQLTYLSSFMIYLFNSLMMFSFLPWVLCHEWREKTLVLFFSHWKTIFFFLNNFLIIITIIYHHLHECWTFPMSLFTNFIANLQIILSSCKSNRNFFL